MIGTILGGLFGSNKLNPIYGSDAGKKANDDLIAQLQALSSGDQKDAIAAYKANLANSTPLANQISGETVNALRGLVKGSQDFNQLDQIKGIGDNLYGKAASLAPTALNLSRAGDVSNRINLGLAPGAGSSLADRARQSVIDSLLASTFNNSTNQINPLFTSSLASRDAERNNIMRSLLGLQMEPDRLATRALMPAYVQQGMLNDDANALANLIASAKNNIQGYKADKNWADRMATADQNSTNQLMQLASTASSLMGGVMGGGAGGVLGGLLGGMGGGARYSGGPSYAQSPYNAALVNPPSFYGGGIGGGYSPPPAYSGRYAVPDAPSFYGGGISFGG